MENENKPASKRLYSLDALRGFDMFWIMGGEGIFIALASLTGWPIFQWCAKQLDHVPWHGFHFYDMIFPLFLFIAGISFPFSYAKRIEKNDSRESIYRHVIFRGLILVVLGILYNNAVNFHLGQLRYGSVLGRIGLAWMFAALIFMNTKRNTRIIWFCGLLFGYWLFLLLVPVHNIRLIPGLLLSEHNLASFQNFSQEGNIASYIDRLIMPGRLYLKNHDPEGILSTIPAISTALLGMFTGEFLLSDYLKDKPLRRVLYMAIAAIVLMIIGQIWNIFFPINKNLWTSSFVCWVGGLSLLLFAIFYLLIDVWNFRKWAFFFVVIGMNPITIYLANRIIGFDSASEFFFGGLAALLPKTWSALIMATGYTAVGWVFLYILYKKKIFLRV
jgi:predicted acyltransferase